MPMPTAGTVKNQFTKFKYDVVSDDIKLDDGSARQDIKMSWLSRYEDCHTHLPVEEEDSLDDNINFDVNNKKGYLVLYAIVLPNNIEGNPATDRTIELKMCNGTTRSITIPASISFEPGISYELTLKDFPEEEESTFKLTGCRWDVLEQKMYVDYEISNYIGSEFGGEYDVVSNAEDVIGGRYDNKDREIIVNNRAYRRLVGTAEFDDFLPNMSYELSPYYWELVSHKVKVIDSKLKIATLQNIENTKWTIIYNARFDNGSFSYSEGGQLAFGKYNDSGMSPAELIDGTDYSNVEWCYDNNLRGYRIDYTYSYDSNSGTEWVINDVCNQDYMEYNMLSGYYLLIVLTHQPHSAF